MRTVSSTILISCSLFLLSCQGNNNNNLIRGRRCGLNLQKESFNPKNKNHNPILIEDFKDSDQLSKIKLEKGGPDGLPVGELKYLNSQVYIVDQVDPENERVMHFEHQISYDKNGETVKDKSGGTQDSFKSICVRGFKAGQQLDLAEYDLPTNITIAENGDIKLKTRTISISFGKTLPKNSLHFEDPDEAQDSNSKLKEFFINENQMYSHKPSTKKVETSEVVNGKTVKKTTVQTITNYNWRITLKNDKKLKAYLSINYQNITEQ